MKMMRWLVVLVIVSAGLCTGAAAQQQATRPDLPALFDKKDVMIPVRDGVKLHTEIYTPRDAKGPLPIFIERSPYGISAADKGYTPILNRYSEMFADGYVFVFQDIRGRYGSEGKFEMNRAAHDPKDTKGTDESTDTYDTIEWLIKNIPNNNGRVGTAGISYGGFLAAMALVNPHPALKAASEQACMGDAWMGDDFFHNGAFRLSYGFEYSALMETSSENYSFKFDSFDLYPWYLRLGPLSTVNSEYFHGKIPTWNNFVSHPAYDSFWQKHAVENALKQTTVPNMNVAGWWDQEDFYGPMRTYANLEKNDAKHLNYLVVGPWNHGGWAHGPGNSLGEIPFGSDTGLYYRQKVEAPWFAYWLHDKGSIPLKEALVFQTGSDTWTSFDAWPPKEAQKKNLYFAPEEKLSFDAPKPEVKSDGQEEFDSYVSDPAHPVPYRHLPVDMTYPEDHPGSWYTWLVQDQRFVEGRPDVLIWQTDELQEDVNIAGQVTAKLFASTTGTDSDWVVKLIDVYPQKMDKDWKLAGFELMVADEIFRGRYRKSYEKPEPIVAGETTPYSIDLHTTNHTFQKGHRIMVQVQSTWFPLYDRNPQKFVPNIFEAKESDYQKATQKIYRSAKYPSSVEVSVVPATAGH
jgi:putative CocE/NonD family hydrolase